MTQSLPRRRFLRTAGAAAVAGFLAQSKAISQQVLRDSDPIEDGRDLRGQYSVIPAVTYLNHASIGTVPIPVQSAHTRYLRLCEENPWLYMWGGEWDHPREQVRAAAADLLNVDASQLALTHNTTEGFNTLAQGIPLGHGDEVLFSDLNHAGASVCWEHHGQQRGYSVRRFSLPRADVAVLSEAEVVQRHLDAISDATSVLVLPHVDNMVGLHHPIAAIAQAARERGVRLILVDGAQAVGMLQVDLASLGVDAYAMSPHKWLQAPKGLGLLYMSKELIEQARPMWVTWGQERWGDSARKFEDYGTRNMAEVLALGDAIAFHQRFTDQREARLKAHFDRTRTLTQDHEKLVWRSPADWELGSSLYAIGLKTGIASELASRLYAAAGIVVRPFDDAGFNALRVSPNLMNVGSDIERLFAVLR